MPILFNKKSEPTNGVENHSDVTEIVTKYIEKIREDYPIAVKSLSRFYPDPVNVIGRCLLAYRFTKGEYAAVKHLLSGSVWNDHCGIDWKKLGVFSANLHMMTILISKFSSKEDLKKGEVFDPLMDVGELLSNIYLSQYTLSLSELAKLVGKIKQASMGPVGYTYPDCVIKTGLSTWEVEWLYYLHVSGDGLNEQSRKVIGKTPLFTVSREGLKRVDEAVSKLTALLRKIEASDKPGFGTVDAPFNPEVGKEEQSEISDKEKKDITKMLNAIRKLGQSLLNTGMPMDEIVAVPQHLKLVDKGYLTQLIFESHDSPVTFPQLSEDSYIFNPSDSENGRHLKIASVGQSLLTLCDKRIKKTGQ